MIELNRLNPIPFEINQNQIKGKLDFFANIPENVFSISFVFENSDNLCPIKVLIKVNDNIYTVFCTRIFPESKTVSSPILPPEFKITEGIKVLKVECFVEDEN